MVEPVFEEPLSQSGREMEALPAGSCCDHLLEAEMQA